jgi:hypothetical protein
MFYRISLISVTCLYISLLINEKLGNSYKKLAKIINIFY